MPACAPGWMDTDLAALVDGVGRGFTVLCCGVEAQVLHAIGAVVGSTGLVLLAERDPTADSAWRAVRCDPPVAIPVRSHVIDAAVVATTDRLPELAAELRRVLVPAGDLRVLTPMRTVDDVDAALRSADIRPLRRVLVVADEWFVLVARGP
jgi:hypothetical protein